jgi:hypothetical protein
VRRLALALVRPARFDVLREPAEAGRQSLGAVGPGTRVQSAGVTDEARFGPAVPEHRPDEIVAALAETFAELTDTEQAPRVTQQIHAGTVHLNCGITLCIPGSQFWRS